MCGRYSLIAEIGELAVRFEFDADGLTQAVRYNIAPTQMVLAVRSRGGQVRLVHAVGIDPVRGEERTLRRSDDQCTGRDGRREAKLPLSP